MIERPYLSAIDSLLVANIHLLFGKTIKGGSKNYVKFIISYVL